MTENVQRFVKSLLDATGISGYVTFVAGLCELGLDGAT